MSDYIRERLAAKSQPVGRSGEHFLPGRLQAYFEPHAPVWSGGVVDYPTLLEHGLPQIDFMTAAATRSADWRSIGRARAGRAGR